jgi:polyhydroxybutyrate depolymerase
VTGAVSTVAVVALLAVCGLGSSCTRAELGAITGSRPSDGGGGGADGGLDADGAPGGTSGRCPSGTLAPGDSTRTVSVRGTSRTYVLHVPAAYDGSRAAPLVLDFHALGVNASGKGERAASPYPAQTDPEGVVMAFPSGLAGPSGPAWNIGPCCVANVDDVAFTMELLADVETVACIDARRIYAVGVSMGGGMAYYLACRAGDVFAAVAPAAFDLLQENVATCTPPRAVTVISFRGRADTLVPYAGGPSSVVAGMPVTFLGAQGTFQKWAEIDGCTGGPSAEDANGCSRYSGCQAGSDVILCSKAGGGQEAGNASFAWPILRAHTL